jgi:hypothetical protein
MTEHQEQVREEAPNRRRYPRVEPPKGMAVAWQAGGMRSVTRVSSLGLGGLFITTPEPPPVGAMLQLAFTVPDGDVRARAAVKSIRPGEGMGVEFKHMGAQGRARLAQLVKRLLPQGESASGIR